jgi:hypothetical protein
MPKPVKPRAPNVIISNHAFERWLERADRRPKKKGRLAAFIENRLYNDLRSGGVELSGLSVELDLGGGIRAVLRLGDMGWVCTTVIDTKEAG